MKEWKNIELIILVPVETVENPEMLDTKAFFYLFADDFRVGELLIGTAVICWKLVRCEKYFFR